MNSLDTRESRPQACNEPVATIPKNLEQSFPNARVLVVEDEGIVACDIQARLESFHYEVPGIACSGEEALQLSAALSPDLVLMDIKLPGQLNGVEAAERLRRELGIPVVFLTANSEQEMVAKAKLTEPLAYVLKPYNERELKIAIEVALYKAKMEREREQLTLQLEQALAEAKILRGLIPVCAWCRKIRSVEGYWLSLEAYLEKQTEATCSHGICPECLHKLHPGNSSREQADASGAGQADLPA